MPRNSRQTSSRARQDARSTPASPSADDGLLELDNQLCFALYAASRAVTATYRRELDRLGLTYPRYLVMLVLWEGDGLTISELGDRLFLDSGTLTPLLKKLESDGLLRRLRDPDDERHVRIVLTSDGRALKERALAVPHALICRLGLQPEYVATVRTKVRKILSILSKPQGESP